MTFFPERPLPSSQLVVLTFRATKATLRQLSLWLIIAVFITSILYFYTAYLATHLQNAVIHISHPQFTLIRNFHVFMQLGYPIIMVFLLLWLFLSMLHHAQLQLSDKPCAYKTVVTAANRCYIRFCLVSLLTIIALTLLSGLILPFIFILPIIVFAPVCNALDSYSILGAFKHAWQLVWGNWWHVFIVILLTLFMPLFVIATISLAFSYLVNAMVFSYVIATLQSLSILIILPLLTNTLLVLYNDLRLRYHAQPA